MVLLVRLTLYLTGLLLIFISFLSPYKPELAILGLEEKNDNSILVATNISAICVILTIICFSLFLFKLRHGQRLLFLKIINIVLLLISIYKFIYWVRYYQG